MPAGSDDYILLPMQGICHGRGLAAGWELILPNFFSGFNIEGVQVKIEDTVKGFKGIIEGKYDSLPEASFYMVGTIDEAVAKAKRLVEGA